MAIYTLRPAERFAGVLFWRDRPEMPNARQTSLIASPSSSQATNRRRSSITEHSFHGIHASPGKGKVLPMCPVQSVTYVSGRSPTGGARLSGGWIGRIDHRIAELQRVSRDRRPQIPTDCSRADRSVWISVLSLTTELPR